MGFLVPPESNEAAHGGNKPGTQFTDERINLAQGQLWPSFEKAAIKEHRRFKRGTASMAAPFRGFLDVA